MFNMTHPSLVVYLRFVWEILLAFLQKDECAMIGRPSNENNSDFQRVICDKYPLIGDSYSFMYGLKIPIEKDGDIVEQNKFYNRRKSGQYVTSIFYL